ncbi:MAG: hypothetical protein V1806_15085 [Pseudomonadota bacterium]
MQYFDELLLTYSSIDSELAIQEEKARKDRDTEIEEAIKRKRDLNDKAYFLLLFAQFEFYVNERCSALIKTESTATSWKQRRPWYILDHRDVIRIDFMKRIALLTEKGCRAFNKINEYYKSRNSLAHGDLPSTAAPLPSIAEDLKIFSEQFQI